MNWSYLFKHWFGTLLLGPLIATIIESSPVINSRLIFGFLEAYPIFLLFSLFFSIPTYTLYALLYCYLDKWNTNTIYAKTILIAFAVSGVIISFWLIGGSFSFNGALSYSISSIIAGLIFKLNFKEIKP